MADIAPLNGGQGNNNNNNNNAGGNNNNRDNNDDDDVNDSARRQFDADRALMKQFYTEFSEGIEDFKPYYLKLRDIKDRALGEHDRVITVRMDHVAKFSQEGEEVRLWRSAANIAPSLLVTFTTRFAHRFARRSYLRDMAPTSKTTPPLRLASLVARRCRLSLSLSLSL